MTEGKTRAPASKASRGKALSNYKDKAMHTEVDVAYQDW